MVAPASSFPSAMSTLPTLILVCASSTRSTPSSLIVPLYVTFPFSSIVNSVSVAIVYPSGATVSFRVYFSPVFNPLISCGVSEDVHSSTTSPSLSRIWMVAPVTSLLSVMSTLLTFTTVGVGSGVGVSFKVLTTSIAPSFTLTLFPLESFTVTL